MTKFKVGDRVVVCQSSPFASIVNEGVIVKIEEWFKGDKKPYCVYFGKGHILWMEKNQLRLKEEEEMENVKSLLKSGDIVVFGSGEKAKVFLDYEPSLYHGKGILAYIKKRSYMVLSDYNDDLFTSSENEYYTINKIYRPKHDGCVMSNNLNDYDLIWERKEVKEMTMKEICEALGYEVKIKKEDK